MPDTSLLEKAGRKQTGPAVGPVPVPTSRFEGALPALVAYLIAGFVLTAHLWSDPAGLRIAGNPGDINLYQWWFGWWPHALSHLQDPFTTYHLNLPSGVNAMANTSMALPGLTFSWLFATAGPLVTYNLLSALSPALSAWTAGLCARRLGVRPVPAYVGGLVFGFSPAIVHSLIGHLSMAMAFLLPVVVLLNVRAWQTDRPRRTGIVLGLTVLAQVMIGEEVLFQAGLATLVILIVLGLSLARSRPSLVRASIMIATRSYGWALAVFVPLAAYPLYLQFAGPHRQHGSPFRIDHFAADLGAFITPAELNYRGPGVGADAFPGGMPEHLAYLGWPLILMCVLTMATRWSDLRVRTAGAGLAVAAVFSMGGTLWVRGQQTTQRLPWAWMEELPVLESALPSRFGLLTAMFAAALLAFGLDAALARTGSALLAPGAVLTTVAVLTTLLPKPLPVERVDDIPRYFTVQARELPADTDALVVPFPNPEQTEPLRWQVAAHYRYRAPGGYFIAPGADRRAYIGAAAGTTQRLLIDLERTGESPVLTPTLRARVAADLARWGIDVVLLGPTRRQSELRALLSQLFVSAPEDVAGVVVWHRPQVRL
jgi:hypothetical protein